MSADKKKGMDKEFQSLVLKKRLLAQMKGGEGVDSELAKVQRRIEEIGREWSLGKDELLDAENLALSKLEPVKRGKTVFLTDTKDLRGAFVLRRTFMQYAGYMVIGLSAFGFIMNVAGQGFLRSLHPDTLGMLLFFAAIGALLVKWSRYGLQKIRFEDDGSLGVHRKGRYEILRFENYRYVLFINTGRHVYYIRKVVLSKEIPSFWKKLLKELSPVDMGDDIAFQFLYWCREEDHNIHIASNTMCDFLLDSCVKAGFEIEYDSRKLPAYGTRKA